jgi:hypothetical protein
MLSPAASRRPEQVSHGWRTTLQEPSDIGCFKPGFTYDHPSRNRERHVLQRLHAVGVGLGNAADLDCFEGTVAVTYEIIRVKERSEP